MILLRVLLVVFALGMVAPSYVHAQEGASIGREIASKKKKAKKAKKAKKHAGKKAKKAKGKKGKKDSHAPKGGVPSSKDLAPQGGELPAHEQGDDLPKPSTEE